jgi:hypothetical protein
LFFAYCPFFDEWFLVCSKIFFFFALYLHFYAHPSVNLRSCSLLCNFQNTLPKIPGAAVFSCCFSKAAFRNRTCKGGDGGTGTGDVGGLGCRLTGEWVKQLHFPTNIPVGVGTTVFAYFKLINCENGDYEHKVEVAGNATITYRSAIYNSTRTGYKSWIVSGDDHVDLTYSNGESYSYVFHSDVTLDYYE